MVRYYLRDNQRYLFEVPPLEADVLQDLSNYLIGLGYKYQQTYASKAVVAFQTKPLVVTSDSIVGIFPTTKHLVTERLAEAYGPKTLAMFYTLNPDKRPPPSRFEREDVI